MVRWAWSVGIAVIALGQALLVEGAQAAQKVAIFPIDMTFPRSEEEFYYGARGPSPDEQKRLDLAHEDLVKRLSERYSIIDLHPFAKQIDDARPIYNCNGCEVDIAKGAGADLAMTSVVDKISETHLSLTIAIVDVAKNAPVSTFSVLIQGNTDEAWLHGVRWLAKNRLLAEAKPQ